MRTALSVICGLACLPAVHSPVAAQARLFGDLHRMLPSDSGTVQALAVGDVDGDGIPDLVVGRSDEQNRLLLNDGTGLFTDVTTTNLPALSDPTHDLALADVDGDLDRDLVVGVWGEQTRLYLNDGQGLFTDATATQLPVDMGNTFALALGDVDDDGDTDLAIGNSSYSGDGQNRLYLNDGNGFFTDVTATNLPVDADETHALVLGDTDRDGDLDLLVGNDNGQNRLYLNDGDGNFTDATAAHLPAIVDTTDALAFLDLNDDLFADLVVGNWTETRLYLNDGMGSFLDVTDTHIPASAGGASSLAAGDVDGDGDPDLLMGINGGQNRLLLNDGSGVFVDATAALLPVDPDDRTVALALWDTDGDLDLDFVGGHSRLYLNDGGGGFTDTSATHMPSSATGTSFALEDVDGDGDPDLMVGTGSWDAGDQNRLYLNDGSGVFTDATATHLPVDGSSIWALEFGDVDLDGDADLVLGDFACGGGQDRLYLNDGMGVFTDVTATHMPTALETTHALALGDVDRDGDLDLVLGWDSGYSDPPYCTGGRPNALYLNDGSGVFTDVSAVQLPADPDGNTLALALGDVDGDLDLDLLVGNSNQQNRLYLNDGLGSFTEATATHMPADSDSTYALALGDVDGDGSPDLVIGNWNQQNRLYLNDGAGIFTDVTVTHMPVEADETASLTLGDVNGDLHADLVVGNYHDPLRLYLNDGFGFFSDATSAHLPFDYSDRTSPVLLDDLDGDHDPDLVFAGHGGAHLLTNLTHQLAWRAIPRVGKDLTMELYGQPGEPWSLSVGPWDLRLATQGLGVAPKLFASGLLDANGRSSASFPVPDQPALVGRTWSWRADFGSQSGLVEHTTFTDL